MEPQLISLVIEYLILALLVYLVVKAIIHSIRFIFFVLLAMLLLVFFFGISYADVASWAEQALLWVI